MHADGRSIGVFRPGAPEKLGVDGRVSVVAASCD